MPQAITEYEKQLAEKRQKMIEYAIGYSEKGLSVIPVDAQTKAPLEPFKDKTRLRPEDMEEVWKKHPDASIALKTEDFFVIDIDVHAGKENGFKSLNDFINKQTELNKDHTQDTILPDTLTQRTASGGAQLFYFKRDDAPLNKQSIGWLESVDVKADKNNYVLVPPSERYVEIDGKRELRAYQWQVENGGKMIKAPKLLIELINDHNKDDKAPSLVNDFNNIGMHQSHNRKGNNNGNRNLIKAINQVIEGLGDEGARNDTLASFVGTLLANGIDIEVALKLSQIANDNTPNPLPIHEMAKTCESIYKSEINKRKNQENEISKGDA